MCCWQGCGGPRVAEILGRAQKAETSVQSCRLTGRQSVITVCTALPLFSAPPLQGALAACVLRYGPAPGLLLLPFPGS